MWAMRLFESKRVRRRFMSGRLESVTSELSVKSMVSFWSCRLGL